MSYFFRLPTRVPLASSPFADKNVLKKVMRIALSLEPFPAAELQPEKHLSEKAKSKFRQQLLVTTLNRQLHSGVGSADVSRLSNELELNTCLLHLKGNRDS